MLFFGNSHCERCNRTLGFDPTTAELVALSELDDGIWQRVSAPEMLFRFCANARYAVCNWLVPVVSGELHCTACRLNRTIPNLDEPGNLDLWRELETAKHRLIYSLLRLDLPVESKRDNPEAGLAFDFLAAVGPDGNEAVPVMTGHCDGLITIDLSEANPAARERRREDLSESYRTLAGHFRHEVGHYYWNRLVASSAALEPFRTLFGDDRQDYGASLEAHYAAGPPQDWENSFVSSYASSHPWEDWAETWAHYLHILDTLESAFAFGLSLRPRHQKDLSVVVDFDPFTQASLARLLDAWFPLTYAVNSMNRCMGQADLYPFVLSPRALQKIEFVHSVLRNHRA